MTVHAEEYIPRELIHGKILLVEGEDDEKFFKHYMIHLGINIDEIHIIKTKGNFNEVYAKSLTTRPDFIGKISILGIIRDSDLGVTSTFEDVKELFNGTNLNFPKSPNCFSNNGIRVGVFVIGNNSDIKMLEDLCLKTVENKPEIQCVNNLFKCVIKIDNREFANPSKSKAQAYLATQTTYAKHIGLGAKAGSWDFTSTALNSLKEFLSNYM